MKPVVISTPAFISNPASKMKRQLFHLARPKNFNHLFLHQKNPTVAKKGVKLFDSNEDSKKSLLADEFSHGNIQSSKAPLKVPKGFLAVYVGSELRRFVIPMACLSMPDFRVLMDRAAEEFGFEQEGALQIPCDEEDFNIVLLSCLEKNKKNDKRR